MIDVIIPTIKSDLPILAKTVESLEKNLIDGVKGIYIVSPNNEEIKHFCKEHNLENVNEVDLLGFAKDDFDIGNNARNGWLYQQLIKLSSDKISSTDDFLVIDSDHILLKPHIFYDGKYHFYVSDEYHKPYFIAINRLFGSKYGKCIGKSFISDKMVFNKSMLNNMRAEIEKHTKNNWLKSIILNYFRESYCGFSEYETYGTFLYDTIKDNMVLHDDLRHMCMTKKIENMTLDEICANYNEYMSITEFKLAK